MALGEADVKARQDEVLQFFAWQRDERGARRAPPAAAAAGGLDLELP